jgi:hypothetical protein
MNAPRGATPVDETDLVKLLAAAGSQLVDDLPPHTDLGQLAQRVEDALREFQLAQLRSSDPLFDVAYVDAVLYDLTLATAALTAALNIMSQAGGAIFMRPSNRGTQ